MKRMLQQAVEKMDNETFEELFNLFLKGELQWPPDLIGAISDRAYPPDAEEELVSIGT